MVRREEKDGRKSSGHIRMEIKQELPSSLSPPAELETYPRPL